MTSEGITHEGVDVSHDLNRELAFYGQAKEAVSIAFGKKNFGSGPLIASATATTTVDNNKMTLMNYEFSLPISYDSKDFGVYLTPTYSIPQNPIKTQTTLDITYKNGTKTSNTFNSTPYSERNLSNNFYVELISVDPSET